MHQRIQHAQNLSAECCTLGGFPLPSCGRVGVKVIQKSPSYNISS